MERVFVTGGSGFLGINLIRMLLEKGYEVISLDLLPFDYEDCKDKIKWVVGDIRNKEQVDECMKGVDYVVHCAAALPSYKKEDIFSTDIDGSKNVTVSAYEHKVKRFIQISTTAVYGIDYNNPTYEDDELKGIGPYGIAKIEAEKVCVEYRDKGMPTAILRPKTFIGPERLGVFALLYEWAKDGHGFPMIGTGKNRYQLLDVEDLCDVIITCMTIDSEKMNDTFNIGAKEYTTMKEDYQAVLDKSGFGKKIHGFPAGPAIFGLRVLEKLHLSPIYNWVYETAAKDSYVSIEKAEKKLDFSPKYSNKDALLRNYDWYLENYEKFSGKSGVNHRSPWKQGVLRVIKLFY